MAVTSSRPQYLVQMIIRGGLNALAHKALDSISRSRRLDLEVLTGVGWAKGLRRSPGGGPSRLSPLVRYNAVDAVDAVDAVCGAGLVGGQVVSAQARPSWRRSVEATPLWRLVARLCRWCSSRW
jgi:hypothetical protein